MEADVRIQAVESLNEFLNTFNKEELDKQKLISNIIPSMSKLTQDSNSKVKCILAESIGSFSKLLKSSEVEKNLIPIIVDLLHSESNEVKIKIIKSLKSLFLLIDEKTFNTSLMSLLQSFAKDNYWRVRKAIIALIVEIGKIKGLDSFKMWEELFFNFFYDNTFYIRLKAIK